MKHKQGYPAKLLLFGEYAVIKDGYALATPFPTFSGDWAMGASNVKDPSLVQLANYIAKQSWAEHFDILGFREEIEQGLVFESQIPRGYGLGSSGALIAAFYDRYFRGEKTENMAQLKQQLAVLESCFHGASSGTDPLICLQQRTFIFQGTKKLIAVDFPKGDPAGKYRLFLLDTGFPRETGPLVRNFLAKYDLLSFSKAVEEQLFPANLEAINSFLHEQWDKFILFFQQIGLFQRDHFQEMIPLGIQDHWSSDHHALKLCGAGGGGFMLGLSFDWERTQAELEQFNLHEILSF